MPPAALHQAAPSLERSLRLCPIPKVNTSAAPSQAQCSYQTSTAEVHAAVPQGHVGETRDQIQLSKQAMLWLSAHARTKDHYLQGREVEE